MKEKYSLPEETLIDFLNNMKKELKIPRDEEVPQRYGSLINERLNDRNNPVCPIILPGFCSYFTPDIHDPGNVEIISIFVESIVINKGNDTIKPNYRDTLRDRIIYSSPDSIYNNEFDALLESNIDLNQQILNETFDEEYLKKKKKKDHPAVTSRTI